MPRGTGGNEGCEGGASVAGDPGEDAPERAPTRAAATQQLADHPGAHAKCRQPPGGLGAAHASPWPPHRHGSLT